MIGGAHEYLATAHKGAKEVSNKNETSFPTQAGNRGKAVTREEPYEKWNHTMPTTSHDSGAQQGQQAAAQHSAASEKREVLFGETAAGALRSHSSGCD
jgi:hypothetical protein